MVKVRWLLETLDVIIGPYGGTADKYCHRLGSATNQYFGLDFRELITGGDG